MPFYPNTLVGYINGEYVYAVTTEGEFGTELVEYTNNETTFIPDWRVDEDPRKVASYVGTAEDRDNDRESHYVGDWLTSKDPVVEVIPTYSGAVGYDLLKPGLVRCWYCDEEFSYRDVVTQIDDLAAMKRFVTEMLVHYSEHRSNGDLPYVRTWFSGKVIAGGKYGTPSIQRKWKITAAH